MTTFSSLLSGGSLLAFLGILVKLAIDTWRKRRRELAEGELAEGSVAPELAEKNLSVLDAQLVLLEKANGAERASYERRIQSLETDVGRLTSERDQLQQLVTTLRDKVDGLQSQLDVVKAQLNVIPPTT